jgi:hypothetical protein
MWLSLLNTKETLKFLDLAIYMVTINGDITEAQKKLLDRISREVGFIVSDYSFDLSDSIEETIDFFCNSNQVVKNTVFLNLVKLSLVDDLYNTAEHAFLEQVQKKLNITQSRRKELMTLAYEERDLREKASRILKA